MSDAPRPIYRTVLEEYLADPDRDVLVRVNGDIVALTLDEVNVLRKAQGLKPISATPRTEENA